MPYINSNRRTHMRSCTLKHRPPVLPQDAVFQLFKPRLKLAAQPLEGKAGRIPVITVWLVEWLQLASLSLADLHTYKKLREARCSYCKVFDSIVSPLWERTKDDAAGQKRSNKSYWWNKYEESLDNNARTIMLCQWWPVSSYIWVTLCKHHHCVIAA